MTLLIFYYTSRIAGLFLLGFGYVRFMQEAYHQQLSVDDIAVDDMHPA